MQRILEEDKKRRFGDDYKPQVKVLESMKDEMVDLFDKMYKIYRMG